MKFDETYFKKLVTQNIGSFTMENMRFGNLQLKKITYEVHRLGIKSFDLKYNPGALAFYGNALKEESLEKEASANNWLFFLKNDQVKEIESFKIKTRGKVDDLIFMLAFDAQVNVAKLHDLIYPHIQEDTLYNGVERIYFR